MTKRTFYKRLVALKNKVKWVCGKRNGGFIQGKIRHGKYKGCIVCPITAVYYFESNKFCNRDNYEFASKEMDITNFASDIAESADHSIGELYVMYDNKKHKNINERNRLLTALGFKPKCP